MITLASSSPQRRAILEQLGIAFEVVAPEGVEELEEGDPREVAVENARRKAAAVAGQRVLGVDTVVALGDRLFGKPADRAEAAKFLGALSGDTHEVHSGVVLREGEAERAAVETTRVTFRDLDGPALEWYAGTGEWRGRAGGYAIQGRGAALVRRIEGDYLNVVGLPAPLLIELAPDLIA